jgi:hypothetical protein
LVFIVSEGWLGRHIKVKDYPFSPMRRGYGEGAKKVAILTIFSVAICPRAL